VGASWWVDGAVHKGVGQDGTEVGSGTGRWAPSRRKHHFVRDRSFPD
jgi:hypothetical protein